MEKQKNVGKEQSPQQTMPWQDPTLMIVMGVVAAGVITGSARTLEKFYINHFIELWMALVWIIVVAFLVIVKKYKDKTECIDDEVTRARHVWREEDSLYVGRTIAGDPVFLPYSIRCGHVQVIGSTGRGKTESIIIPWMVRDFKEGHSSVIIDGKGDPSLQEKLATSVGSENLKVLSFTKNSISVNPLLRGTTQEIVDRVMASFDFDNSFYRAVQMKNLQLIVSLIKNAKEVVTFKKIYEAFQSDQKLGQYMGLDPDKKERAELSAYLSKDKPKRDEDNLGLTTQIAAFAKGELSEFLNSESDALADALITKTKPVVYLVLIPTLKLQRMGRQLGRLFLQEIAWAVGERAHIFKDEAPFVGVFLDEFSSFAYDGFEQILNKARSSKVALHLSHQSLGDLENVSPAFAKTVNTNTNVKCLLGLNDPVTADFFAKHIGTRKDEKTTERYFDDETYFGVNRKKTGDVSLREVETYIISPNTLKNFGAGRGVIHLPTPDGNYTAEVKFSRGSGTSWRDAE